MSEVNRVVERYARRAPGDAYSILRPEVCAALQERQRCITSFLRGLDVAELTLLDVGCGAGWALLDFLRLGFDPQKLSGIELLPERAERARRVLPSSVSIYCGDAASQRIASESQDIVTQFVVFSSLLDGGFQAQLAERMWDWIRPGGHLLWYDFAVNNPRNPDVRGIPLHRVRALFPGGAIRSRRITLAPPIARAFPAAYGLINSLALLRTHRLVWIQKPAR